jgi:hypothetical protein
MGVMASASSVLSGLIDCTKLIQNAETLGDDSKREVVVLPHNEAADLPLDSTITFAHRDDQ